MLLSRVFMMFVKTKTKKAVLKRFLDSGRQYRRNFDVTLYSSKHHDDILKDRSIEKIHVVTKVPQNRMTLAQLLIV